MHALITGVGMELLTAIGVTALVAVPRPRDRELRERHVLLGRAAIAAGGRLVGF